MSEQQLDRVIYGRLDMRESNPWRLYEWPYLKRRKPGRCYQGPGDPLLECEGAPLGL
jgi:hypothetical protein